MPHTYTLTSRIDNGVIRIFLVLSEGITERVEPTALGRQVRQCDDRAAVS